MATILGNLVSVDPYNLSVPNWLVTPELLLNRPRIRQSAYTTAGSIYNEQPEVTQQINIYTFIHKYERINKYSYK